MRQEERERTLIACPACDRGVSLGAEVCPGCGARLRAPRGRGWRRAQLVGVVAFAGAMYLAYYVGRRPYSADWLQDVVPVLAMVGVLVFLVATVGKIVSGTWRG